MKIGFAISTSLGGTMYVESNDRETGKDALSDVVDFLHKVNEPCVQKFAKKLLKIRIKEDNAESPGKEGEQ